MFCPSIILSIMILILGIARATVDSKMTIESNSRSKRFIYYNSENRLALPPGTLLVMTPTLQIPSHRNLPVGYGSHMTVSIPFAINFDDLGMTSEENPWGLWPKFGKIREKREAWSPLPGINWAGGDREVMFHVVENYIGLVGLPGKACLLRAICEMFETPLPNHGFFGDVMELFFSVSKSPHAEKRMADYLEAERLGKNHKSCSKFYSGCEHSLFANNGQSKWKKPAGHEDPKHIKKESLGTSGEKENHLPRTDEVESLDELINNHRAEEHKFKIM